MNFKKFLGIAVVVFIVWYMVSAPNAAANTFDSLKSGVENIFGSLATFFTSVTP